MPDIDLDQYTGGMTAAEVGAALAGVNGTHFSAAAPSGFAWPVSLPDVVAYKNGQFLGCSVTPSDLFDSSDISQTYYVDISAGSDSNDGLTVGAAKKSIHAAISAAEATGNPARIMVKGGYYGVGNSFSNETATTTTVKLLIEAYEGRVITGAFDPASTYTQHGTYTNCWEVSVSNIAVVDSTDVDQFGRMFAYPKVDDLATCNSTPGTYTRPSPFTKVYIHTKTSTAPNYKSGLITLRQKRSNLTISAPVLVRGFDFVGGITVTCTQSGYTNFVQVDCSHTSGAKESAGAAVAGDAVEILGSVFHAAFNCDASDGSKDGFNYHSSGGQYGAALLVNCSSFNSGWLFGSQSSCNGVTSHEGIPLIDIGGTWLGARGTGSGHVDGAHVWAVGAKAGSSVGDIPNGGSIDYGAFGVWDTNAKIWLDSCEDVGAVKGIYVEAGCNAYIRNHSGLGARTGSITAY